MEEAPGSNYMALVFPQQPEDLYLVQHEYSGTTRTCPHSNFLKGVKWSPDGACLLTASDDSWMRIYDLPPDCLDIPAQPLNHRAVPSTSTDPGGHGQGQVVPVAGPCSSGRERPDSLQSALSVNEGETVYDYVWYPRMSAVDPATCCFAASSRDHPIHLWDACTGELRCTYRGYNDVDEVTAAYSMAFTPDGTKMFGGYNKNIKVFDVSRPGRSYGRINTHVKHQDSLTGIVSCLAFSPDGTTLAAGSYTGMLGLYDARTQEPLLLLQGHKGGLTQVSMSGDGTFLFSGARQDSDLIVWDVRYTQDALYRLQRDSSATNQRIQFSIEPCGRHLATGGCSGTIKVFDLQTGGTVDEVAVCDDTVNGCDFHPFLNLLALASGHRRYPFKIRTADNDSDTENNDSCTAGPSAPAIALQQPSNTAHATGQAPGHGAGSDRVASHGAAGGQGAPAAEGLTNVFRVLRCKHELLAYPDEGADEATAAEGKGDQNVVSEMEVAGTSGAS